jgi:hypothetical protein
VRVCVCMHTMHLSRYYRYCAVQVACETAMTNTASVRNSDVKSDRQVTTQTKSDLSNKLISVYSNISNTS